MASDESPSAAVFFRALRTPLCTVALLSVAGATLAIAGTSAPLQLALSPEKFLAKNEQVKGVQKTASGLQYKVIKLGNGPQPNASDMVSIDYQGSLTDGTVFDSTARNGGTPMVMPVSKVIPGFSEALQLMKQGSEYRFWIPPHLGYGAEGAGNVIPPNAVLVFDIKLISVVPVPAEQMAIPSAQP
ncbi:MAG: FKBP-type peptidyl-prolyl cis-trans isomerase [Zymomonas mobilis subsp. pomaceae]|uniref:Peptidyl-prolyl cis-trans isomerase n=1 Tax=Zymomonas mobilis subsp. pomaceae (strain ATCC 29192 / DSM 22645 / JCM 10191 / CCUG 17912 / NBRC 13757 / NCIMB 11200 / NRRL B-4491 / Barker I) TaxID=579138 RepID=F8EV77_ZYMMT|nr:FKBP-type peptidyl-prolyl cis-trans isomerase [Zymomonas mobilis]AEI38295.1 peptidylprolyl isomerase FKBP-type [Zymomonas mobilis subsp. pomaceae ATCC 29192]MDX5947983.1 FKBP-type peptidyl-prolyl cis-trans isomerase [Zymomonas mobilis subsp. pomaceae]GEB89314.1 hypothetical protein ZMO02_09510 [Zymomonas mobilis subsp. pomaceae]